MGARTVKDTFRDDIMKMVKQKYDAGLATEITDVKIEEPEETSNVVDLTELLRKSLQGRSAPAPRKAAVPKKEKAPPPAARKRANARGSKAVH